MITTQPRNILDVIDAVERVLAEHPTSLDLPTVLDRLRALRQSVSYTAPEDMTVRWYELAHTVAATLGLPDVAWKREVAAILRGERTVPTNSTAPAPPYDGVTRRHVSLCEACIHRRRDQVEMLSGYCLTACRCDGCGCTADLAMVAFHGSLVPPA